MLCIPALDSRTAAITGCLRIPECSGLFPPNGLPDYGFKVSPLDSRGAFLAGNLNVTAI